MKSTEILEKKVAAMQPTFIPWMGYIEMISTVDEFVFLDAVDFDRSSWQQRNYLRLGGQDKLVTVPVDLKDSSSRSIRDVKLSEFVLFSQKFLESLRRNYKRSPYFKEVMPELEQLFQSSKFEYLLDLNISLIEFLMDWYGVKTKTILSSELEPEGKKSHLLLDICRLTGATNYLSPPGSRDYIDQEGVFASANFPVTYFQPVWSPPSHSTGRKLSSLHYVFEGNRGLLSGA